MKGERVAWRCVSQFYSVAIANRIYAFCISGHHQWWEDSWWKNEESKLGSRVIWLDTCRGCRSWFVRLLHALCLAPMPLSSLTNHYRNQLQIGPRMSDGAVFILPLSTSVGCQPRKCATSLSCRDVHFDFRRFQVLVGDRLLSHVLVANHYAASYCHCPWQLECRHQWLDPSIYVFTKGHSHASNVLVANHYAAPSYYHCPWQLECSHQWFDPSIYSTCLPRATLMLVTYWGLGYIIGYAFASLSNPFSSLFPSLTRDLEVCCAVVTGWWNCGSVIVVLSWCHSCF